MPRFATKENLKTIVGALRDEMPDATSATPKADGTASAGSSDDYARADHVHPTDTSRASTAVATTSANGLMSASDKAKLDGIEAGANSYSLPTMSESTKGGAKVGYGLNVENDILSIGGVDDPNDAGPIVELTADGWAEQSATVGKNLAKPNSAITDGTTGGITYTYLGGGRWNVAGTNTYDNTTTTHSFRMYDLGVLTAGTYTVKFELVSGTSDKTLIARLGSGSSAAYYSGFTTVTESTDICVRTFTADGSTQFWVCMQFAASATVNGIFRMQVEAGSTATSYEPYSGAKPSPNPDYPQEIRRCVGRNLIDATDITLSGGGNIVNRSVSVAAGTYTLSFDSTATGGMQLFVRDVGASSQHQVTLSTGSLKVGRVTTTFTLSSDIDQMRFYVNAAGIYSNIQLELGSTAHPYVPYGCVGVDVQGRNLSEPNVSNAITVNGITLTHNNDGTAVFNGTSTSVNAMPTSKEYSLGVLKSGTYTAAIWMLSGTCSSTHRVRIGVSANSTYVNGSPYVSEGVSSYTFTANGTDEYYAAVQIHDTGAVCNDATFAVQVTKGDVVLPYEPYVNYSIPVPLPQRGWVASLPDGTADMLTLDGAGGYEWEMATGEATLDGSEFWSVQNYGKRVRTSDYTPLAKAMASEYDVTNGYATHFRAITPRQSWYENMLGFAWDNSTSVAGLLFNDGTGSMTVESWKTWLSSHPVTVLYPLATPTRESGYVDMPTVPVHATLTCPEMRDLAVRCCADEGTAEISAAWAERTDAELGDAIVELAADVVSKTKIDGSTIKRNSNGELYVDIPSLMGVSY